MKHFTSCCCSIKTSKKPWQHPHHHFQVFPAYWNHHQPVRIWWQHRSIQHIWSSLIWPCISISQNYDSVDFSFWWLFFDIPTFTSSTAFCKASRQFPKCCLWGDSSFRMRVFICADLAWGSKEKLLAWYLGRLTMIFIKLWHQLLQYDN